MVRGFCLSGNLSVVSGVTGWPVETVAREGKGPLLFQLCHFGDRSWVKEILGRVEASGYRALCLIGDTPVYGRRERDLHRRFDGRFARPDSPNPLTPDPTIRQD